MTTDDLPVSALLERAALVEREISELVAAVDTHMVEVMPEIKERLEQAFLDWFGRWYNALQDGGTGDVVQLYVALNTAVDDA